jgi:LPXTG-motif cell wall-anchored protein
MASRSGVPGQRQAEEAIVRKSVRNMVGVILVGLVGALALPALAGSAAAQTAPPTPECVILSVTPNPVAAFPSNITVTGTVDAPVHLTLYAQAPPLTGPQTVLAQEDAVPGSYSITGQVTQVSNISLGITYGNQNAYTGVCATVGGEVVVRVTAAEAPANVTKPAAAALAFTGSSDTPSFVLIGIAAVVVGAVLVVAARRRRQVS